LYSKPRADLVFIDECHRSLARSYVELLGHYPRAVIIGLTATPYRADGKGLGDMYDALVLVSSPRELIDHGYLVEPRVFTVPESAMPDLDGVRVRGGDYDEKALERAVDRSVLVGNIVEHWLKHAGGIRTVAFAVSVAHSRHIVERFREAGVAAEHLDGATPTTERDAILARLEEGTTTVVSNVGCLCEGYDQPAVNRALRACA
jgi:superfamily II DNA or RNA helicase